VKLVSLSMVRNEADVIEAWARHHAEAIDSMIVVCNRSTDNTSELLHALRSEGLPLEVHDRDRVDYAQGEITTKLMHSALKRHDPDWLIPLDADEFLISNSSDSARAALERLPPDRVALVQVRTYVVSEDDPDDPNVLRRLKRRRRVPAEDDFWRRALVPRRLAGPRTHVVTGGERLVDSDTGNVVVCAPVADPLLAHFPYRSSNQAYVKIVGTAIAQRAVPDFSSGTLRRQTDLATAVLERPVLGVRELRSLALSRTLSGPEPDDRDLELAPVPVSFELRLKARPAELQAVVLDAAIALADDVAQLRAPSRARRRAEWVVIRARRALRRLYPSR
jgi:hypothetical protein